MKREAVVWRKAVFWALLMVATLLRPGGADERFAHSERHKLGAKAVGDVCQETVNPPGEVVNGHQVNPGNWLWGGSNNGATWTASFPAAPAAQHDVRFEGKYRQRGGIGGNGGPGGPELLDWEMDVLVDGGIDVHITDGKTAIPLGAKENYGESQTPGDATVTWSVQTGTGAATIDANGKLTGTKAGTVTVKVRAEKDGKIGEDEREVTVFDIKLIKKTLPNDFIALPDKILHNRIGKEVQQKTKTQMNIVYSVYPEDFSFAKVTLKIKGSKDNAVSFNLEKVTGQNVNETVEIELDDAWEIADDYAKLALILTGEYGSDKIDVTDQADGKRIFYDLEYWPKAYKGSNAVCPFSDYHENIGGIEDFYGLLSTYSLAVDVDSVAITIKSDSWQGDKTLSVIDAAKKNGTLRPVKWECYHDKVIEPAATVTRTESSEDVAKKTIREGLDYKSSIIISDTNRYLQQKHFVNGIKLSVKYRID